MGRGQAGRLRPAPARGHLVYAVPAHAAALSDCRPARVFRPKDDVKEEAMPRAFAVEATIARPADEVWQALTDWGSAHRWMAGVDWLKAEGEAAVGTRITFRARDQDRTSTITSWQPGRSFVLRSAHGGVTADYEYAAEASSAGATRVTLTADCRMQGPWRFLAPLIRMAIRKADSGQLAALKQLLECDS